MSEILTPEHVAALRATYGPHNLTCCVGIETRFKDVDELCDSHEALRARCEELERERDALDIKLAGSIAIQEAEKKILLLEVAKNERLRGALIRLPCTCLHSQHGGTQECARCAVLSAAPPTDHDAAIRAEERERCIERADQALTLALLSEAPLRAVRNTVANAIRKEDADE